MHILPAFFQANARNQYQIRQKETYEKMHKNKRLSQRPFLSGKMKDSVRGTFSHGLE